MIFPLKPPYIVGFHGFSMAMLNNQMVTMLTCIFPSFLDPWGLKSLEELSPVITALREIEATWSETVTWQDAARDYP